MKKMIIIEKDKKEPKKKKEKIDKIDDGTMFLIDLENNLLEKPYAINKIIYDEKLDRYFFIFVDKVGIISYIYEVKKLDFKKKFVENATFISNVFDKEFTKKEIEVIVDEIFNRDDKLNAESVKFKGDKLLAFKRKMNDRFSGKRASTRLFLTLNVPNQFIRNEKVDFVSLMIYIIDYYRKKLKLD